MIPRKNYSTYDVTTPKGLNLARGAMWVYCENGDPQKAVMYRGYSIQGNSDKRICERIQNHILNANWCLSKLFIHLGRIKNEDTRRGFKDGVVA